MEIINYGIWKQKRTKKRTKWNYRISLFIRIGDMVSIICDEIEDETIQELEYEFENSEFSNSVANYQYEFTSKLMKILEKI